MLPYALTPLYTNNLFSRIPVVTGELLSVGTELLLGEIVDTNSAYLAADLSKRGVNIYRSVRVGDNLGRVAGAVREALSRSDLLVMCGGLGPTDDDLTREAVAEVLGETPEVDSGLERDLRERFATFSRTMPERNLKQAWLIPSAEALPNPLGTAPGWLVQTRMNGEEKRIVLLPGPPRELKRMWTEEVLPRLKLPEAHLFTRTFKTFGLGESAAAERLGGLTDGANPSVATYAKRDGVHIRVAAQGASRAEAEERAAGVVGQVAETLGDTVWGTDDDEMAAIVLARLEGRRETLATMESLTGGMVGETLTSVAGASQVYLGGVVAYALQAKAAFGVPESLLQKHGSVSEEAATAMAEAASRLFGADWSLATTGVAGPGESEGKSVGEVHLAVCYAGGSVTKSLKFPPLTRDWLRERATFSALSLLLKTLDADR